MRTLLLFFLLIPLTLPAQTLPVDSASGKIYFAEEVLVKDAPKTDLYNRAKSWFKNKQKISSIFLQDDLQQGLLIVKSGFNLEFCQKQKVVIYSVTYIIQLEIEDDKYFVRLHNFRLQELSSLINLDNEKFQNNSKPLEEVLEDKSLVASQKELIKLLNISINQRIQKKIEDFKNSML